MLELVIFSIVMIIIVILFTIGFEPQPTLPFIDPIDDNTFPFHVFIINLDRKPERYKYVTNQLDSMGITEYTRISGTDGFKADRKDIEAAGVSPVLYNKGKGVAGCAASHVRVWKHIADNDLDWCLILEDDAHFHPDFKKLFSKYWNQVPSNAMMIYPGYCSAIETTDTPVLRNAVMCLQGYMISAKGARHLLNNLLPIIVSVDVAIEKHFMLRNDSYVFNGNAEIDGIRPFNYKESNDKKCMFNGIIYQNRGEYGSIIHEIDMVLE